MLEHTAEAKRFYRSTAWKKCRESYIITVHGLCERCFAPGKIVHHKEHIDSRNINDPFVTLSHENLEYLCQTCHNKEHHQAPPMREGIHFDDLGNLVVRYDVADELTTD